MTITISGQPILMVKDLGIGAVGYVPVFVCAGVLPDAYSPILEEPIPHLGDFYRVERVGEDILDVEWTSVVTHPIDPLVTKLKEVVDYLKCGALLTDEPGSRWLRFSAEIIADVLQAHGYFD